MCPGNAGKAGEVGRLEDELAKARAAEGAAKAQLLQESADDSDVSPVAIVTHVCSRGDIEAASAQVSALEASVGAPQVIPIDAAM